MSFHRFIVVISNLLKPDRSCHPIQSEQTSYSREFFPRYSIENYLWWKKLKEHDGSFGELEDPATKKVTVYLKGLAIFRGEERASTWSHFLPVDKSFLCHPSKRIVAQSQYLSFPLLSSSLFLFPTSFSGKSEIDKILYNLLVYSGCIFDEFDEFEVLDAFTYLVFVHTVMR